MPATAGAAAVRRWGGRQLPIQLAWLPTSAAWLNPIEKSGRAMRPEITRQRPRADTLEE